eukprot:TRINITY_DN7021_c1_g1_i1.p1 TRINITY_DN7021_c1_g1~~TRINITY_DN7021_c1_g1_i1.p1  ORF type:complete len:316 (-),score=31.92 TRINITY_DN7021_c1_g1_i1:214-1161(-)
MRRQKNRQFLAFAQRYCCNNVTILGNVSFNKYITNGKTTIFPDNQSPSRARLPQSSPPSFWSLSFSPSAISTVIGYARFASTRPQDRIEQAQSVLASANAAALRERIEAEGEGRLSLRYKEFVDLCMREGFADTEEQAAEMCRAMHAAGVVMKHCNMIYIRPLEVADMVLQALPDTEEEIQDKIKEIEKQLLPLQQRKEQCDRVAEFWSSTLVWGGFFFLVFQFILFFRFTFFTYSWDVMEPVTYFAGQVLVLLGYIYFLTTKEDFGLRNYTDRLRSTFAQQTQKQEKFDLERYNRLTKDIQRWQRYLRRFKHVL